jgi:hypothetical protein
MLSKPQSTSDSPTWESHIQDLLARPYWIEPKSRREAVGDAWRVAMKHYGARIPPADPNAKPLGLDNYDQVKMQAVTIYQHLASRSMPVTKDATEYWPEKALDLLREWINHGCRRSVSDPMTVLQPPLLALKTPIFRLRKDLRDLTTEELSMYRSKLQDVLGTEKLNSKWQELGQLHAWWCLHYQEATFFWHRCYLRMVEELIDFPIPYWNGFATDTAEPHSLHAGIPRIFLEDDYVDPSGDRRENPLKYAYSFDGKCKSDPSSTSCQRNPILQRGQPSKPGPERDAWDNHIRLFKKYHDQIEVAMQQKIFSLPQYDPADTFQAKPAWANLPGFSPDMPDSDYTVAWGTFDGHFEQAHDNFHGWVGGPTGEMSDNTFTAFDPIFLSYHCNMDRLFEHYLRSNPGTRVSADFPLRPFVDRGKGIDLTNPNSWAYTTTGEVIRPTAALGYVYAPPACPDVFSLLKPTSPIPPASGGTMVHPLQVQRCSDAIVLNVTSIERPEKTLYIVFEDVVCTTRSYIIDLFVNGVSSLEPDTATKPRFVDRLFRFGMGVPPDGFEFQNAGRCRKRAVSRCVNVTAVAHQFEQLGWHQVVTELDGSKNGRVMDQSEWKGMAGFQGRLEWVYQV